MKSLAAFIMRGRFQALLVTVAGAGSLMFCWISAAAVALVTLRKGVGSGAWLLAWGLLPAGTLVVAYGDSGPLTLLVGAAVLALVLRLTVSLPMAILASVPVGILSGVLLMVLGGEYLDLMVTYFGEFLATLEQQLSAGGETVVLAKPDALQIAGMLGAGNAMVAVLCLLLARYWQAALYNPGGFGQEFRALYYPPAVSLALVLGAIALWSAGLGYRSWAMICVMPLTFAGLALVHARAALAGSGRGWLTGFYVAWVFFDPVKLVVVATAVADGWLGFRQRWARKGGDQGPTDDEQDK